jgi:hypothetical protein
VVDILVVIWGVVGLAGLAMPNVARAQPVAKPPSSSDTVNIEADPIRCWWRTSSGAVRTGETFTLVLTCAVMENDAVQIVPDEGRLGPEVIQMAPFEIVDGSNPEDLRTANRRFFQYDYRLRMINPDFIGRDVRIPDLSIHYRVNSRVAGIADLQGRDFVYLLPPQTMRILSMVPADATDIRDASGESFAAFESLGFRANMLRIVAISLLAIGGLLALLSLVRLLGGARKRKPTERHAISTSAVLAVAGRELENVQRESEQGWSEALAARALAASRVVAACAMDQAPSQQLASRDTVAGEGLLTRPSRRGKTTTIWSTVTAGVVTEQLATRLASASPDRRPLLESLQAALATLTAAQYGRGATLDRPSLDAALTSAIEAARTLRSEYAWPKPYLRRLTSRTAQPEPQT